MGTISRTAKAGGGTNFNAGQTINPTENNSDFNTAYTEINGLLDDANIESGTIPGSKTLRFTERSAPSNPSANDILLYSMDEDGTTRLVARDSSGNLTNVVVPRGYVAGLTLSNNGSDATNDIDIAAGACESHSARGYLMVLGTAITKQIDAAWAVGTNAGGMDTGSVADSTWYHVHLIQRSDTGVTDALFSLSATAPTMPTSYDRRRRIGSVYRTSGSAILAFTQTGNLFQWATPQTDVDENPIVDTAAILRTLSVAPDVRTEAVLNYYYQANASATQRYLYLSDPNVTDWAANPTNSPGATAVANNAFFTLARIVVPTNTSRQVRSRSTMSTTGTRLVLHTLGWYDKRGSDL